MCYTFDLPGPAQGEAPRQASQDPTNQPNTAEATSGRFRARKVKAIMTQPPRRCGASRKDGRPCRAWAVRGSEPARCASHLGQPLREQEAEKPEAGDFYESAYEVREAADLLYKAAEKELKGELRITRVALRRALEQLRQELQPSEYARLIELIFKGAHTVADILRIQRSLSGDEELFPPEIGEAIDYVRGQRDKESSSGRTKDEG
jgi:hypothetical protein